MKLKTFTKCSDLDIMSKLKQGMKIMGLRWEKGRDDPIKVIYRIDFDPVFFGYSGNWTLRCHSRTINKEAKIGEHDNLTEYVYINTKCLHKYKFPSQLVIDHNKEKELANFLPKPTTNKTYDPFTLSTEHLQSSPFRESEKGKGKTIQFGNKGRRGKR